MKVLLVNQFFWPDAAATSQLLTDVAHGLAAAGHQVTAVCAAGGYAGGPSGEEAALASGPRVEIRRAPALPFGRGSAARIVSYGSFLAAAVWEGFRAQKPDVVLTLTTPPLLSLVGSLLKLTRGARHVIWEMDVYPDVAVDLGYLPAGGMIERLTGALADASRRYSDRVIVLGPCMRDRLARRKIPLERLAIAENWADRHEIRPVAFPRRERLVVLYSGNLGLAHDVETVKTAMRELEAETVAAFVFAGGGPKRAALERWCQAEGLQHVEFRQYRKREQLGASLGSGDVGLVTQKAACLGSVVPSKVYGLMAAARPILFVGPREATPARIIRKFDCGWQIDCGDAGGLAELLRILTGQRAMVEAAGARARQAFLEHYDRVAGVGRILSLLGAPGTDHGESGSVQSAARNILKQPF